VRQSGPFSPDAMAAIDGTWWEISHETTFVLDDLSRAGSISRDVFFRAPVGQNLSHGFRPSLQHVLAAVLDRPDLNVHVARVQARDRPDLQRPSRGGENPSE